MADEKTRCPKCLAWYNPLEGEHECLEYTYLYERHSANKDSE